MDELQTAIDLNDNRAVYRSRFLLEQDEAARIDALGRIYADLGFTRLASVEAYKSLQTSAANYSAHRLLADAYRADSSANLAHWSELLQSQLLQPCEQESPATHNDLQDVHHRWRRPDSWRVFGVRTDIHQPYGLNLQINGTGGTDHTAANDLILSGLHNRIAFSLVQSHFETEGWRENNDLETDRGDAFLQIALTPASSLQFEYRQAESKHGDLALKFDPENYSDNARSGLKNRIRRIGFHHQLASNGHLIVSLIDHDQQESCRSTSRFVIPRIRLPSGAVYPGLLVDSHSVTLAAEARSYESQLIQPFHDHTFIFGAGSHDEAIARTPSEQATLSLLLPDPPFDYPIRYFSAPPHTSEFDSAFKNTYLYGQFALPARLNLTLGLSHEKFEGWSSKSTANKTNPKFGLTWEIWEKFIFRAAYLEAYTSLP